MKRAFALVTLLVQGVVFATPHTSVNPPKTPLVPPGGQLVADVGRPVRLNFSGISVAQVVSVVYSEILKQPYVIDPAVLKDERQVSFRFDASEKSMKEFWRDFVDAMGLEVTARAGVDYVAVKKTVDRKLEEDRQPFIYRSKHRPVGYLVEMLSPLFPAGGFALNRTVRAPVGDRVQLGGSVSSSAIPAGSAAALIDQDSDVLIFQGTEKEIALFKKIVSSVDVAVGEIVVRAVVYEVATGKADGTAFSLAANLLGGRLGISVGTSPALPNSITISSSRFDATMSVLSADSRFKAISTPHLRVKSGQQAQLVVGQE